MKKLLITMAMMCAVAMAQTSTPTTGDQSSTAGTTASSSPQTSTDTSASTTHKHKAHTKSDADDASAKPESDKSADAKDKTVKGCLHKDGDNLWLKTRMGKYHVMSSQDLSAHDGHEVKVTGKVSKAPMPGSTDKKDIKHLEASNVEMVSDKCAMGTKSMKMKNDEMSKEGDATKKK